MPISMHLYPVQGPLAERKPSPAISATVLGTVHSASFSVTMPDGEAFHGPLTPVAPADSANDDLAPVWDGVYGPGYYAAVALGSPARGRAVLQGTRGSTLSIETNRTSRDAPVEGVGKDTNGNVFKVAR
jgi:hypothetical protein